MSTLSGLPSSKYQTWGGEPTVYLDWTPGANRITKEQWYEITFANPVTRAREIENFEKTRYLTPCRCTWDLCSGWQVAWRLGR